MIILQWVLKEAIQASNFIDCNRVMGYHFDTFGYIEINHEEAIKAFSSKNKELILLNIGKSIEI